jgi:hypothetical protein
MGHALKLINGGKNKSAKPVDERHIKFKDIIWRCYKFLNNGETPAWDGSDAKQLALLLKAKPDLTEDKFHSWLVNYAKSGNMNPADRPRKFLPRITDYASGPLNEFGRPLEKKK